MVPTDDDGRRDGTSTDELVERQTGPRPFPIAEPADPSRQTLERHLCLGHLDPAPKPGIVWKELKNRLVGGQDVGRVAGQRRPSERTAALAELGPDECRDEPRISERVRDPA